MGIGSARWGKGPFRPVIAPGGTIRLNNDWIAGFTAAVSWLMGSLVPDRDQGKLQPQARIVLGDGERG